MTRAQRNLIYVIIILGGLLPVLIYWTGHNGLGNSAIVEYKAMSRGLQLAQVIAGLYIKPVYMLISLALIIGLLNQTALEIVSLRWGLIAFLTGEIFCAVNFITYKHEAQIAEYIHSFGMVLAFGFVTYALLEILDRRLLHINHGRCAANELCESCNRTSPLQCSARRVSLMMLLMVGSASFIPLAVSVSPKSYLTDLFGYTYSYARFDFYQWYETRALPSIALAFFIITFILLLNPKSDPLPVTAKIFFSAGIGALGFSFFRLALAAMFADNLVWFEFWEEATELMFVSALGFLLWQFRNSLLQKTPILEIMLGRLN